jgi:PPE family protein
MTLPWPPIPGVPGPGEHISTMLYSGAGSSSFFTASAQLQSLSSQLLSILTQQQTNAVQLDAAWQGPAGQSAVLANEPYEAWLKTAAAHVEATALHTATAGSAFEMARGLAEPPAFWEMLDWICYAWMVCIQVFPLSAVVLAPLIAQNRATWGAATALAVGGYSMYQVESAPLQSHPPLVSPPMSANLGAPGIPAATGSPNSSATSAVNAASPVGSITTALPTSVGSSVSQLLSAPSSLLSQPGSAVSGLSSVGSMAGMPASMGSSMAASPTAGLAGSGTAGGDAASWYGGAAAGAGAGAAPVTATMSSGGFGSTAALAAVRGPASWSSTASVASPTQNANEVLFSQTRPAAATSATSGGMGSPGMVPPARRDSNVREDALDKALETAAAQYRGPPSTVPVVTGAAGAYFSAGEEDQ